MRWVLGLPLLLLMISPAIILGTPSLWTREHKFNGALIQMRGFRQALEAYRRDQGVYPTTKQGLQALVSKPKGMLPHWSGPYFDFMRQNRARSRAVPPDSWGRGYIYLSKGKTYTLMTLGSDGLKGGSGQATDVWCTPTYCTSHKGPQFLP